MHGHVQWEKLKEEEKTLYRTTRKHKRRCWDKWKQTVEGKDVWKAVRCTREREGRHIPTLEGPRNKAVTIEEKEELLRSTGFPTPPRNQEKQLPTAGNIHDKITQETLQKAIFKKSENKGPGPDRVTLKAISMIWAWEQNVLSTSLGNA
jgi:hypothetical protein